MIEIYVKNKSPVVETIYRMTEDHTFIKKNIFGHRKYASRGALRVYLYFYTQKLKIKRKSAQPDY